MKCGENRELSVKIIIMAAVAYSKWAVIEDMHMNECSGLLVLFQSCWSYLKLFMGPVLLAM